MAAIDNYWNLHVTMVTRQHSWIMTISLPNIDPDFVRSDDREQKTNAVVIDTIFFFFFSSSFFFSDLT